VGQSSIHEQAAAYALDALDDRGREEFEQHLATCTVCKEELQSLRSAAAALAYAVDVPDPPDALKERLLERARREAAPTAVTPLRRRLALPAVAALAAASAAAAVGLSVWVSSLQNSLDRNRNAGRAQAQVLAVLAAPGTRRVQLEGANGSLVVAPSGDAALIVSNLSRAPSGHTYEAWVIRNARPRPAGTFAAGGGRTVLPLSRAVRSGSRVAVTLEPGRGSELPTGQPLFGAEVS
jgi:hypothetical protein